MIRLYGGPPAEPGIVQLLPGIEGRSRHRDRLAVVARIAGPELHPRPGVVEHRLAVAEVRRARWPHLQIVPEPGELRSDLLGHARLALHVPCFDCDLSDAVRLQRLLDA